MSAEILRLGEVGRGDVNIAGGKGANLGELVGKGFPVPPGFVVSAHACEKFFMAIDLEKELGNLNDIPSEELEKHCQKIQGLIEKAELPSGLTDSILSAHAELADSRGSDIVCAVRSSATAEDLGDASFAGQHATYYYVDRDRLLRMIGHCWASLWNPEAVQYRSTQGIDHASVFMAVVVQEMIHSEVSGVTFTANPVTGSQDEIVTESSWGMGAAIVDGRVTPDHYVVEREGFKLREKRIADKRFMVPSRLEEGSATRLQEVPHGMRQKETLSPDLIRTVTHWAVKAEEHFGKPQDVEWAITDGQFYMLQSRPITVMGQEDIARGVDGEYVVFKPLVENFTDPVTPLTADFYQLGFAPPLFRTVKGWLYVNLKPLRTILPFKISDDDLTALLYDFGTKPLMKLSFIKLPLFLLFLFWGYLTFGVFYARTRRMPGNFMDIFRKLSEKVDNDPEFGPFETFYRLLSWSKFFDPAGNQVFPVNLSAPRYIGFLDMLENRLNKWLPDLREDAASLLCSGSEGVLSAEMGRGIWELAKEAKRHKSVRDLLEKHKPDKVLRELKAEPEAKGFLEQLDRFLAKNGHRGLKELELRSPRWEENPAPVLGMVRNYMLVETDPTEHEKEVNRARTELEQEIREKLEEYPLERMFRLRWRMIRHLANRMKYFARMRENSRFYHIMGFSTLRKKILRIEEAFIQEGKLKCRGDIFFLRLKEMDQMRAGKLEWRDVEDKIRDRRMEHIRLSKMSPPKAIGIKLPEAVRPEKDSEEGISFKGQPASPGNYEGKAHVILDPSIDVELKPGEILVAPYTDPAWTPLFLTAGAAIVEVGSYLSHAGTVAREFGMPCVVDLPDCTKRVHTGCKVQVDGDHGVVRLISEDEGEEQ
ncbi:PEP/pyruvate-binding domain-containing protein [Thermodesulfobacteriota bacterium]